MAVARITLLTIASLLGVCATYAAVPHSRLLEGENATTGEHPFVASVRLDNTHVGVGSIIEEGYVLTAAHFLSELGATPIAASRITVRVGSINQFSGGQIIRTKSISIHPSYGNFLHDVAIIALNSSLTWTDKIGKIDLVAENEDPAENAQVTVSGWGLQSTGESPYKLQHTNLTVLSTAECELEAGYGYESALCLSSAVNQGVCRGDDGAGVVSNKKLAGVVSFAFGSCGTKYPDVAGRISYYSDWIASIIAK